MQIEAYNEQELWANYKEAIKAFATDVYAWCWHMAKEENHIMRCTTQGRGNPGRVLSYKMNEMNHPCQTIAVNIGTD